MSEAEFENFYKERLEEKIILCLAKHRNIDFQKALDIYYNSRLATLIEQGTYEIHYLDYQVLTDELEKEIMN